MFRWKHLLGKEPSKLLGSPKRGACFDERNRIYKLAFRPEHEFAFQPRRRGERLVSRKKSLRKNKKIRKFLVNH